MAKVLYAEDDFELAGHLTKFLTSHHYLIEHTADGGDALYILRTFGFDAAILDWELPGMSGVEVCQQLRREGSKLPVIILTGRGSTPDTIEGIDAGADDYIVKPVDPLVLLAKLKALLRRTEERTDNLLRLAGLELDPDTHRVNYEGLPISLLPKEFSLLEFFMRHPNQVYSGEEIISHVWSADEGVSIESVRSCMFRLRKKLQVKGHPEVIENIYGVGYILRG